MIDPQLAKWHNLFYGTPTEKDPLLRDFGRWLRNNRLTFLTLYHGTWEGHPVMDKGLLPTCTSRAKSLQSSHGFVCLSAFSSSAQTFGEMAYVGKKVVVYEVTLCIRHLLPDKDQLFNQRQWAGRTWLKDTLAHSLVFGHGARVRGKITPHYIRRFSESEINLVHG